jgi:hypothetical protein
VVEPDSEDETPEPPSEETTDPSGPFEELPGGDELHAAVRATLAAMAIE